MAGVILSSFHILNWLVTLVLVFLDEKAQNEDILGLMGIHNHLNPKYISNDQSICFKPAPLLNLQKIGHEENPLIFVTIENQGK